MESYELSARDQMGKRNTTTNLEDVQVATCLLGEPLPVTATSGWAGVSWPCQIHQWQKRRLEKSLTDSLQLWTTHKQDDNDELFGRPIAAQLRCLSIPGKSLAKFNIQKGEKVYMNVV